MVFPLICKFFGKNTPFSIINLSVDERKSTYLLICIEMLKTKYLKKLGERVVELRTKKGWSQRDLAFACNKEPQSIERIENGKSNPTAFYLKELADALEIPVSDFFNF